MDIGLISVLLFVCLFLFFIIGVPIGFSMLITGMIFGILLWGPSRIYVFAASTYGSLSSQVLIAVPLFILMGNVLIYTGMSKAMLKALYAWAGPLRGVMAMATVGVGAIWGAMSGSAAATTVAIGGMALPVMFDHDYDKKLAIGSVAVVGVLDFLIPPSILAIIFGSIAKLSVGKLYLAMFIPGFLLAGLYILYIGIRCALQPHLAPAIPKEERLSWTEKIISLKGVLPPIFIILMVIGGIFSGITTPTEAAGMGAFLSFVFAFFSKALTWERIKDISSSTIRMTSMIAWMIIGVTVFSNVYNAIGAPELIERVVKLLPGGSYGALIMMQLSLFLLGMMLDDLAIVLLTTPIYVPIAVSLGFDPLWFAVVVMVNMQIAWLTPPYGFALFYARAIVPKDIPMSEIYKAVIPFICLQLICLVIVMVFPSLSTWLPSVLITK